ncbi:MAG: sulfite exporter TauE/SafE family protein [Acidobacteriota bacterium]
MMKKKLFTSIQPFYFTGILLILVFSVFNQSLSAHPLGNFTVNHYSRIQIHRDRINIRYVVDMAEIPAFQTLATLDTDNNGKPSQAALTAYGEQTAKLYAKGLSLLLDGEPLELKTLSQTVSTPDGNGGLPTLRIECEFSSNIKTTNDTQRLVYRDSNHTERSGWHEIVIAPDAGLAVFDSTAFANGITDELRAYPEDRLAAPLDERSAELAFTTTAVPANAQILMTREGRAIKPNRDHLVELITVKELTLPVALFGLLIATGLGAIHALSPGHGKTVVGAYLVGSRGTARHAMFLGMTVTITHTLGVFALGLVTLFASKYILPEKLFPIISLISGVMVLFLGLNLFFKRLAVALGYKSDSHHHSHDEQHTHSHDGHHHHSHSIDGRHHDHHHSHHQHSHNEHHHEPALAHAHSHHSHEPHTHSHTREQQPHHHEHLAHGLRTPDSRLQTFTHTHDGHTHTHLPPGTDGSPITWRSLLALGISGGLLPCPSALVVLLTAISLGRVGYGLFLVMAFSAGLAATLTAVGLIFLYAGRLLKRPVQQSKLVYVLPVISSLVIATLGAVICYQALASNGFTL